ncbi:UvrD-like helicase C-terminal domain protein, partial [Leptospira interrogans serovar Icterohaemorrhagiae str. Verdun HP]
NEIFGGKSGKQSFFPILEQSIPIQYEPVFAPKENIKVLLSDKQKQGPIQIVRFTGKDFWNTQDAKNAWGQFISEEILKLIHKEDPFTYQVAEGDLYYVEKKLKLREIAVLVKSKSEGKLAEQFLKLRGIPCSFYKQEGIYQSAESYQISNIFECLLDPNKPSSYRKL